MGEKLIALFGMLDLVIDPAAPPRQPYVLYSTTSQRLTSAVHRRHGLPRLPVESPTIYDSLSMGEAHQAIDICCIEIVSHGDTCVMQHKHRLHVAW